MISINSRIPEMALQIVTLQGKSEINSSSLFERKTILFGLPGAFTPVCSQTQLPSFAQQEGTLRAKGYENIVCLSVNDAFVMQAWKEQLAPEANIIMLADGSANFTKALGLELDLTQMNMGMRSTRFLAVIENNVVTQLNIEENPGVCSISNASSLL